MLDTPKLPETFKEADLFLRIGAAKICETRTKQVSKNNLTRHLLMRTIRH